MISKFIIGEHYSIVQQKGKSAYEEKKVHQKKLLPLMLILMLILGISMPANATVNPRLNSTKKGFVRGKNISVKGCKLEESREMVFFQ